MADQTNKVTAAISEHDTTQKTFLTSLENLLNKNETVKSNSASLKDEFIKLSLETNKPITEILLLSKQVREHFFKDTSGTLEFDSSKLMQFLSETDATPSNKEAGRCPIPDDHIDPRRSALFMARSILGEVRDGGRAC